MIQRLGSNRNRSGRTPVPCAVFALAVALLTPRLTQASNSGIPAAAPDMCDRLRVFDGFAGASLPVDVMVALSAGDTPSHPETVLVKADCLFVLSATRQSLLIPRSDSPVKWLVVDVTDPQSDTPLPSTYSVRPSTEVKRR